MRENPPTRKNHRRPRENLYATKPGEVHAKARLVSRLASHCRPQTAYQYKS